MNSRILRIVAIWLTVSGSVVAVGLLAAAFSTHGYGGGLEFLAGIDGREYIKLGALISAWPLLRAWQESRAHPI